jgi:RNA polymerase sigma-70 factor, ECF subfamily
MALPASLVAAPRNASQLVSSAVDVDGTDAASLVEAIASQRDRAAFARLFALYGPRVRSQLCARGASLTVADEVTQEVMLTVWRKAGQFDPRRGRVGTWLFVIARNCLIDHQRGQRWPQPEPDDDVRADAPDDQLAEAERQRDLRAALDELPLEQREALAGAYYRGRTMRELADEHRLPVGTVKTRVRLGLARLRACLGGKALPDG